MGLTQLRAQTLTNDGETHKTLGVAGENVTAHTDSRRHPAEVYHGLYGAACHDVNRCKNGHICCFCTSRGENYSFFFLFFYNKQSFSLRAELLKLSLKAVKNDLMIFIYTYFFKLNHMTDFETEGSFSLL